VSQKNINSNNSVDPKRIWIIFGRNTARGICSLLLCSLNYYLTSQLGTSLCCYGDWFDEAPSLGTQGGKLYRAWFVRKNIASVSTLAVDFIFFTEEKFFTVAPLVNSKMIALRCHCYRDVTLVYPPVRFFFEGRVESGHKVNYVAYGLWLSIFTRLRCDELPLHLVPFKSNSMCPWVAQPVKARLPDGWVSYKTIVDHRSRQPVFLQLPIEVFMVKFINYDQKKFCTLTFWLPPEVFIRRMKTSFLHQVLGTVSSRCAKKQSYAWLSW